MKPPPARALGGRKPGLYLSFTKVVAFTPTGTLPLTIRVKGLMALQAVISLVVPVAVLTESSTSSPHDGSALLCLPLT
jgi:hypothetical protein